MKRLNDNILTLIIDFYSRNCTEDDMRRLDEWVAESNENEELFRRCLNLLTDIKLSQKAASTRDMKNLLKRESSFTPRPKRMRRIWYAAAVAVIAGAGFFFIDRFADREKEIIAVVDENVTLWLPDGTAVEMDRASEDGVIADEGDVSIVRRDGRLVHEKHGAGSATAELRWATVDIPRGTVFDMALEDGTRVWLNADSRLRFPVAFADGERRVILDGEAYFEVAPDAAKPFLVESRGQVTEVVGTTFNVSAYADNGRVATTLVTGSVRVCSVNSGVCVPLVPGQQAVFDPETGDFRTGKADIMKATAWRNKIFVFEGTLENAMAQLARWYDMEYFFVDEAARAIPLQGSMPVQSDVEQILSLWESAGKVRFEIDGKKVNVYIKR